MTRRAHLSQRISGVYLGTGGSPGGAPLFPAGSSRSFKHPKRRVRPPPGPLTDSADTQATKPKVSRIHARRIFPRDRLLPAAACNQGKTKPPAQRSAQPAHTNPEQSSRSDCGSGSETRARGSGALASSSCACSRRPQLRPGNAAPSHLLVSALPTRSWCSGMGAL